MPWATDLASLKEPGKRYTKFQCIGRGASKTVYKGFDEVEGIEVAWNEVACSDLVLGSDKEMQAIMGEIHMLRSLKHRNIMRLYDWWYDRQAQVVVFITELLTDGSLRRFIRRKHTAGITMSALKRYAWQVLQGLLYLHGHFPPIIHRDLKCDNIFVNGAAGELKIGDLGFATLLKGMSAPLSVIGTPEFMAPELYEELYNEKVDVYSFGMCVLEMATQEYPYGECTNPAQIYRKVTQGIPPAALQKVTCPQLKEFIMLTIDPDPTRRPEARQLLVHPFFEDVRQQIRIKGLRLPRSAANAAATAAAALAAAGMPGAEVLALEASVIGGGSGVSGGGSSSSMPPLPPLESVPEDQQQQQQQQHLVAAHEAAAAQSWHAGDDVGSAMAAAAAVAAMMSAVDLDGGQQQQQQQPPLLPAHELSAVPSVLPTECSSLASVSSWGSRSAPGDLHQMLSSQHSSFSRQAAAARRSLDAAGGRRSIDEMSEEDVLFDTPDAQAHARPAANSGQEGDGGEEADGDDWQQQQAHAARHSHHLHFLQQQQQEQEQQEYLSPIDEDDDEEEGVDCECRRIDQESLSFHVGFFNAKGMKRRVGFEFNALEDTPESIGIEMVEQLQLTAHQVNAIADRIRAALAELGIASNGSIGCAAAAAAAAQAGHSGDAALDSAQLGESAAIAIVATVAATAAIEEAASDVLPDVAAGGHAEPGAAAAAAGDADDALGDAAAFASSPGERAGSLPCSRASSVTGADSQARTPGSSLGRSMPGTSPGSRGLLLGVSPTTASAGLVHQVCPQQLVRQLSMLGRDTGAALLHNLQSDLLQQSFALPEAAAAVGFDAPDLLGGSVSDQQQRQQECAAPEGEGGAWQRR